MLLLLILIVLFLGCGGTYYGHQTYGPNGGYGFGIGTILIILLLFLLLRGRI